VSAVFCARVICYACDGLELYTITPPPPLPPLTPFAVLQAKPDKGKLIECTIGPGDLLYFPPLIYHATLNYGDYNAFVSSFTVERPETFAGLR
jgi:hypothetical protein